MQEPGTNRPSNSQPASSPPPSQTTAPETFGYNSPIPDPTGMDIRNRPMGIMGQNDSGSGSTAVLPDELKWFNWGAFLMSWIWGIGHQVWIALLGLVLGFIPVIGGFAALGFQIYLGIKGNELAWQNRRFESIQQFKDVQRIWTRWGIGLLIVSILIGIAMIPVILRMSQTQQPPQNVFMPAR